ncbi:MAG: GspH/FimT family pseudopilin [Desulfotignum sp.]
MPGWKRVFPFKGPAGVSLVEMMVVMALIGLLTGMAVPNIRKHLPAYRLNAQARQIMTDVHYARGRAASLNREYRIELDINTQVYVVNQGDKSNGSTIWTPEKSVPVRKEKGIVIVSVSSNPVWIKPAGTMAGTTITVQNAEGESIVITASFVGRIKKSPIIR